MSKCFIQESGMEIAGVSHVTSEGIMHVQSICKMMMCSMTYVVPYNFHEFNKICNPPCVI